MKHIGLFDIDSHNFPNLPLMKVSAYWKEKGADVNFNIYLKKYDEAYISKVFTFSEEPFDIIMSDVIHKGGTGFNDYTTRLPDEIENHFPDYSLYPQYKKTAVGYLTRGCPRQCGFCIVEKKDGTNVRKVSDLKGFWNGHKEISIMDDNILALRDRQEKIDLLQQLINSKSYINFLAGLDIRMMDEECANMLLDMKIRTFHFAWDRYQDEKIITTKLNEFMEYRNKRGLIDPRNFAVYVLTNFDTTPLQDLDRIYKLRDLGYNPFVMIYDQDKLPVDAPQKIMGGWVNQKAVWWRVKKIEEFERYRRKYGDARAEVAFK